MNLRINKTIKHLYNILFYPTPNMLVYFVTGRCNARCKMCFYATTSRISKDELTLKEIEKISRSLGPVYWLLLSGGEPFLRKDLPELCSIFIQNNDVKYLQIPTNAWNPKSITQMTKKILDNNPNLANLVINVSIDHIGKKHDQIRGVPGLFNQLTKTVQALNKLKKQYANLGLAANITYSGYNYKDIFQIYQTIKKAFILDNISLTLMRGTPRDKAALKFTTDNFFKLFQQIESSNQYQYYSPLKKILAKGKDHYRKKIIHNAVVKHQYTLPCRAGKNSVILGEKGDVYVCELRDDRLGNIRDYDYDFKKLWSALPVKKARKNIARTKCYCTYECVISPNTLFNFQYLLRSIWKGLFSGKKIN